MRRQPIRIGGVDYPTFKAAWEAVGKPHGVTLGAARQRFQRGDFTIEEVFTLPPIAPTGRKRIVCVYEGRKWPDAKAMCRELGVCFTAFWDWRKRNAPRQYLIDLAPFFKECKERRMGRPTPITVKGEVYPSLLAAWRVHGKPYGLPYTTVQKRRRWGKDNPDEIFALRR